jgi:DNA-binding XRE family transcriptional regulator
MTRVRVTTATSDSASPLDRVGQAVVERRLDLGLTQRELADKAGVSLNTAALLERGHTFPRRANARKLEEALEWPRGTLAELRRGGQPTAPAGPAQRPPSPPAVVPVAGSSAQALAIAKGVVGVAETCMRILADRGGDPAAAQALRDLDAQLLGLETLIAASLPHAESFDDTMSALAELHRRREAVRDAAAHAAAG